MKKQLLIAFTFLGILTVSAQTTHNLDWFAGIGSNVDLTIETGDTVIWTWTSPNHTVENDPSGSSVETFNSGVLAPNGSTFSHTFTVVGSNDYYCGIHGAASMSGTITVEDILGVDENELKLFTIVSNPVTDMLVVEFPQVLTGVKLTIHDLLGKNVFNQTFNENQTINVNVSEFNRGLYLISIESENKKQTQRFIKI